MHFMKSQLEPNTPATQLMQVTNRIISDLEGRGTMRSAPETCNLNAYLDDKDVLAAEFIRTYMTVVFPGGSFLHRQELEDAAIAPPEAAPQQKRKRTAPLPVSRRINPKCPKLQKPDVDIYGYRGTDKRVHYLSPWEFMSLWGAVQLFPPCSQTDKVCTICLEGGLEYYNAHKHDAQGATLKPGIHYKVLDSIAGPLA